MYSMVLMAAMTTAPDLPEARSHRGHGCASSCASSCAPASCGGGHGRHKHKGGHGGCISGCGGCGSMAGCGGCGGYGGTMMGGCGGCGGYAMADPTGPMMAAGLADAPATIVVTGAADATITLNEYVTNSRGDTRVLVTPQLAAGGSYHYDFKAEVVRDGQRVAVTKTVTVRPGVTTEVQLDLATSAVVMK